MKKFIVPVDGSDNSMRAIDKAVEMAKLLDGELVIFNAVDNIKFYSSSESDIERLDGLQDYSKSILTSAQTHIDKLAFTNYQLVSEIGDPTSAICDYAAKNGMDLIVIGSQGINAGKFRGIFVGSIANKVVSCSDLPVMVIK